MIRHILKDGTVLTDITGHVVKVEDVPMAYQIMDELNEAYLISQSRKNKGGTE